MKYFLSFILLICALPLRGQAQLNDVLNSLDCKIDERYIYMVEKDRRIDALKFNLNNSVDAATNAQLCHDLFEEYKTYQYDSAYLYALRVRDFAIESNSPDVIAQWLCDILYCYSTAGFFKEGADIISSFNTENVSDRVLAHFYCGCIRYYFNLMRYVESTEELTHLYREEMRRNTELALKYLPANSFDYKFIDTQSVILLGDDDSSSRSGIEMVQELLLTPNLSLNNKAIMYSWLGMAYKQVDDIDSAIIYTALSVIADIESCTYETTSAKVLSEYMYQRADIVRASKYINMALIDANTYNSPYRKLEIQAIMPDIVDQRLYLMQKDTQFLIIVSSIIILLLLLIVVMFINIHHRNIALRVARAEIEEHVGELAQMNERLSSVNIELSQANQIKDRYIIESLYSDSKFVDNVEKVCKVLIRKIKAKQYTELMELISGIHIKQERQRMSSTFDSAFLKLFPNFISEYNMLFATEQAVSLGEGGELSPEIRIFALIRLGVEDVALISKYLNLSPNTVYVYKAKVKARTIVPKEEFEERIKAIKQPY